MNGTFQWSSVEDKTPKMVAYSLLILISLLGNSLILWTVYIDNRLRTALNFLIANMALSDFLATIITMPSMILQLHYDGVWALNDYSGRAICKLLPYVVQASSAISQHACIFIALERYYAATKKKFRKSRVGSICIAIWIVSAVETTPFLYFWNSYRRIKNICILDPFPINFVYTLLALTGGLPIIIIFILCILIVLARKQNRPRAHKIECLKRSRRKKRKNRNILKMALVIILSTFLSVVINFVIVIFGSNGRIDSTTSDWNGWNFSLLFVSRFSMCYNFFILLLYNKVFRRKFRKMVCGIFCN